MASYLDRFNSDYRALIDRLIINERKTKLKYVIKSANVNYAIIIEANGV